MGGKDLSSCRAAEHPVCRGAMLTASLPLPLPLLLPLPAATAAVASHIRPRIRWGA